MPAHMAELHLVCRKTQENSVNTRALDQWFNMSKAVIIPHLDEPQVRGRLQAQRDDTSVGLVLLSSFVVVKACASSVLWLVLQRGVSTSFAIVVAWTYQCALFIFFFPPPQLYYTMGVECVTGIHVLHWWSVNQVPKNCPLKASLSAHLK